MIQHKSASQTTRRHLLAAFAALSTLTTWRADAAHPGQAGALQSFARRLIRNIDLAVHLPTHTPVRITLRNDWSDLQLVTHLGRMLDINPAMVSQYSQMSDATLRVHLRERIESNYRQGDLIQLQGWWLSKTEYHAFLMTSQALI